MERLHFRSTSLVDLQAELHERDLLSQAHDAARDPAVRRRPRRAVTFGLSLVRRRIFG